MSMKKDLTPLGGSQVLSILSVYQSCLSVFGGQIFLLLLDKLHYFAVIIQLSVVCG
jgi:hypothetical protein